MKLSFVHVLPLVVSLAAAYDFVGLWEGIDPLDGAQMQRSFILLGGENYTIVGRIEHSQICGSGTSGNVTDEPDAGSGLGLELIPAMLNSAEAAVLLDGEEEIIDATLSLTCVGEEEIRIPAIPAQFIPISANVLVEVPAFRAESPIYLHRISALECSPAGAGAPAELSKDGGGRRALRGEVSD